MNPQNPQNPQNPPLNPASPEMQPLPAVAESSRRMPGWRLWLPLLFQAILIVAVPAKDAYTYMAGKPVVLQTVPVDPYDVLRGYSQTLRYDISDLSLLRSIPGGAALSEVSGRPTRFYVVLEAPTPSSATPPQPWKPVQIRVDRPTDLKPNQAAVQAQSSGGQVTYGLETYYMPENQRRQINADISQVQLQSQESFVVEAKVDATGNAVPVSLWVRDRNYRF